MKKARLIYLIVLGLLFLASCKNGKLTEVTVESFPDGMPQKVFYYSVKEGDSTLVKSLEYHPNHMLFMEGFYKNNTRNGHWKSWRDNGILWSEAYYKEGVNDGMSKTYYENGQLYYSGEYKNGERIGTWKFYDENGKFIKEIKY